jgi:hypothetical protein
MLSTYICTVARCPSALATPVSAVVVVCNGAASVAARVCVVVPRVLVELVSVNRADAAVYVAALMIPPPTPAAFGGACLRHTEIKRHEHQWHECPHHYTAVNNAFKSLLTR